ncbi:ABC transporter ATP-binding protein [Sinorhizobium medicae]|uniref:ABC transporter ATP-binding protein n=1 Tax=Sinorhizobium medicae TaxID=110321 RepID=UPI000FDA9C64|nr:ABC transporter ATP-binding protein [Sinorhizobium medicae]RVO73532.1 ABC transporter ATP-binding protein [Sinorhizobium medicae]
MTNVLTIAGLHSGYGPISVLHDISLTVSEGEITAIVGANGAGKSTLLLTLTGHVPPTQGSIKFLGKEIAGQPAHLAAPLGISMVPEGGRLFPFMTVQENLQLGAYHPAARQRLRETMEEMESFFPILAQRRTQNAGSLSGGERTMLAIARAMMARPRLLLLDEPSLGLAPVMVERVISLIDNLAKKKKLTVLLVEQRVAEALELCHNAYIMEHGRIVKSGTGIALAKDPQIQRAYLGLTD